MKHWTKIMLAALLAMAMTLSLAACGKKEAAQGGETNAAPTEQTVESGIKTYENGGLTLSVPAEYDALLQVETPTEGAFFKVSELKSVETAKKLGESTDYAGWIFSITAVDEAELHALLCGDMSGAQVFARDNYGNCYLYEHPTDVSIVREDYSVIGDETSEDWQNWSSLHEWASTVRREFLIDNQNELAPFERGNSMLDICLARAAYQSDAAYQLSTTEHGPYMGESSIAAGYAEQLMSGNGVSYELVDASETPDGEYVVFSFPDDGVRFDFFRAEGKENYVRAVWSDYEELWLAHFADDTLKASDIMQAWYQELVDMGVGSTLGSADDLVGEWAESIAGRGVIEIAKAEDGTYNVLVNWSSSAFEHSAWQMTGVAGTGAVISYDDCKLTNIVSESETESTDTVEYENGTGRLFLEDGNLVWVDEVQHIADGSVFIKVN